MPNTGKVQSETRVASQHCIGKGGSAENSIFDRKLTFSSVQLFGATTNNVKHLIKVWNPIDLLFSVF